MRRAVIDNSTLTAVQRLLGDIPVKNKHTLDGDILAFETFIQTLLFFDEVCYLNDYKEQYRASRASYFYYLNELSIEKESYHLLQAKTRELWEDVVPRVEGGTYADENFRDFFALLKMHNVFTWDMSSSVYYLTQKMLNAPGNEIDIDKYSKLHQMIFHEMQDAFEKPEKRSAIFKDSNGHLISDNYEVVDKGGTMCEAHISKQTEWFMANLSWLAYRTIFYTLAANELGGSLVLHPIRNAFQVNYMNQLSAMFQNTSKRVIDAMNMPVEKTLHSIYEPSQPLVSKYTLPMFSAALTEQAGSPKEAVHLALRIKQEGPFVEARRRLAELEDLCQNRQQKALTEANKLVREVEQLMQRLGEKYYVSTPQGIPLSPLIQTYNIGAVFSGGGLPQIPEIPVKVRALGKIRDWLPQRGFNAVYKSLINDLTSIGQLGRYHEMLTADVSYARDAAYHDAKTEGVEYLHAKSYWKIPM